MDRKTPLLIFNLYRQAFDTGLLSALPLFVGALDFLSDRIKVTSQRWPFLTTIHFSESMFFAEATEPLASQAIAMANWFLPRFLGLRSTFLARISRNLN